MGQSGNPETKSYLTEIELLGLRVSLADFQPSGPGSIPGHDQISYIFTLIKLMKYHICIKKNYVLTTILLKKMCRILYKV